MTIFKHVKDFMNEKLVTIEPKASATDAAKLMLENKISSLIVKDSDEIFCGILTEEDISQKVVALGQLPAHTLVKDIMTEKIVAVESGSTMRKAFLEMNRLKIRHIAVTENGRYVGVLSVKDFASYYASRIMKKNKK